MSERPQAGMMIESIRQTISDELLDHPSVEGYVAEDELRDAMTHLDAAQIDVNRGENDES